MPSEGVLNYSSHTSNQILFCWLSQNLGLTPDAVAHICLYSWSQAVYLSWWPSLTNKRHANITVLCWSGMMTEQGICYDRTYESEYADVRSVSVYFI